MVSRPSVKLAVAAPPSWALSTVRRVAGVAAAPFTVMVPPEKTISARVWMTPAALVTATVVCPEKPAMALSNDWPTLRPFRLVGAGTAELALCARFSSSAAWATSSASRSAAAGASMSLSSTRPLISPDLTLSSSDRFCPPGSVIQTSLKAVSPVIVPARL